MVVVVTFYAFLAREAAEFYTSDNNIIGLARKIFRLYMLLYPGDCVQIVLSSGLRAVGMERLGVFMFVVCFYCFGLPLSYCLGFPAGLGVIGITIGNIIALYVMLIWLGIIYWRIDWNVQVELIAKRLREDKRALYQPND